MALITKSEVIRITSGRGFSELQITDSDIAVCERKYLRDLVLGSDLYNRIVAVQVSHVPTGFGYLYNKYAINNVSGIAPTGWHVPTTTEWDVLAAYVATSVGGKLKSTKTLPVPLGWTYPNTSATDTYGFGMLPGGFIDDTGTFGNVNNNGYMWLANEIAGDPYMVTFNYNAATATYSDTIDNVGASVRFVMDDPTVWYEGYTVTDVSGNVYPTVKIGSQVWTAANFMSTKYNDAHSMFNPSDGADFTIDTTGAYIVYNTDVNNIGTIPTSVYDSFITSYVKPTLAWAVFTHILDRIQVEVTDRGMFQLGAQNAQTISRADIEGYKASIRENLNSYLEETRQYVIAQVEAGTAIYSTYFIINEDDTVKNDSFVVRSNTKKIYHV